MARLDDIDRKILLLLQEDATLSHQDLADRVGASSTSCWRRIKAMEDAGIIDGRVLLVNAEQVDRNVSVLCSVHLKDHSPDVRKAIERFVEERPEVMECYSMSGDTDYMMRIVVPDVEAYEHFLMAHLLSNPHVASASSSFALRQVKYTTALPI